MSIALAQERIDRKLEQKIDVLEQTVLLLGDQLQSLKLSAGLQCHVEFDNICVTPQAYNASSWKWNRVKAHLWAYGKPQMLPWTL